MKGSSAVHSTTTEHPSPLEDPERVTVDRKHVPAKAVQEHATRSFP